MFYVEDEIKHMDINLKLQNKLKIQSKLYGNIKQFEEYVTNTLKYNWIMWGYSSLAVFNPYRSYVLREI